MPSIDPVTGRRLSGSAQLKLKSARQPSANLASTPKVTRSVPKPPAIRPNHDLSLVAPRVPFPGLSTPCGSVEQVSSWGARLAVAAAGLLADPSTPPEYVVRSVLLGRALKKLGAMHSRALRSEKGMLLRDGGIDHFADTITDDISVHSWAYCRVARLIYHAAVASTMPLPDAQRFILAVEALAVLKDLSCDAAFSKLLAEVS